MSTGRQSSAGKFFGRRLHKDKEKADANQSPPGSAQGSQSSRHHRQSSSVASVDRPVSMAIEPGLAMQAGVYSSIPFEQTADGRAPPPGSTVANHSIRGGDALQPHHLNQSGADFHQYPIFDASKMPTVTYQPPQGGSGAPRPPPHTQRGEAMASSQPGDRGVSIQQWGAAARSSNGYSSYAATDSSNNTRTSSDQASIYSNDSKSRSSNVYIAQTPSQSTFSSIGLDTGSLLPTAVSTPRDSHRHMLHHGNQPPSSAFSSTASFQQNGAASIQRPPDHIVEQEFMNLMVKRGSTLR